MTTTSSNVPRGTHRPRKQKFCGSKVVPCFRCYLSISGEPEKRSYIVRAVNIQRFIDQQIKRDIMHTVLIVDYLYHELPHGELFVTEPPMHEHYK